MEPGRPRTSRERADHRFFRIERRDAAEGFRLAEVWYSVVVEPGQPVDEEFNLGSWNGDVLGERAAKKSAKAVIRTYKRARGPGKPRLVKSDEILAGSADRTLSL